MAPEYIAIIASISVLGGVIIIGLIAVCIANIVTTSRMKAAGGVHQQEDTYRETVALPSYVHYPGPEPYTAVAEHTEEHPWPPYDTKGQDFPDDITDLAMPRASLAAQDPLGRLSHAHPPPHRPQSAQNIPRRTSYIQDIPRSRYSYAPDIPRRQSEAHAVSRRASAPSQVPGQYNRHTQEPSSSQDKLWFNYLLDDPDYYSPEGLQWNKRQPRIWQDKRGKTMLPTPHRSPPSPPPPNHHHHHHHHRAAASRLNWM